MNPTTNKVLWSAGSLLLISGLVFGITRMNFKVPEDEADAVEEVNCSGKPVFRYKHPSKMFPVITRDYSTNSKVTTDLLNTIISDSSANFSLDVEASNTAKRLREELNQDNIFYENQLKAIFFEVNRKPCDDSLSSLYTSYIRDLTMRTIQLKEFLASVTRPIADIEDPKDLDDSALVIIDTTKAEVKEATHFTSKDLVVMKREATISQALNGLNEKIAEQVSSARYSVVAEEKQYIAARESKTLLSKDKKEVLTVFVVRMNAMKEQAIIQLVSGTEKSDLLTVSPGKSATHFFRNSTFRVIITVSDFKTKANTVYGNFTVRAEKKLILTP